jgi:hypothetical protein
MTTTADAYTAPPTQSWTTDATHDDTVTPSMTVPSAIHDTRQRRPWRHRHAAHDDIVASATVDAL